VVASVVVVGRVVDVVGTVVVDVCGTVVDGGMVVVVGATVVDVLDDVDEVVEDGGGGGGEPPRAASTSPRNEPVTYPYRSLPGQVVWLMSRCPAMVGVVTEVPSGHLLEPRETKLTSAPGAVETAKRSANHARTWTSDAWAAGVAGDALVSPMRHTSWEKPWLPPVADPATASSRLPSRPSQTPPAESITKL
jgi:hypothetical protein